MKEINVAQYFYQEKKNYSNLSFLDNPSVWQWSNPIYLPMEVIVCRHVIVNPLKAIFFNNVVHFLLSAL